MAVEQRNRVRKVYMRALFPPSQVIQSSNGVDPQIGRKRDAELCRAHAFGVSLDEWLSIELEG